MNKKILILICVIVVLLFSFFFIKGVKKERKLITTTTTKPFFDQEIMAKSFLIGDIKNDKIIYSENENLLTPIASISKLISAMIVLDNMDMGQYIKVTREHQKGLESLKFYLHETVSVKDVLYMGLIMSSNDAFSMLAHTYGYSSFIYKMNMKSDMMGMGNSNFVEPTGLSFENTSTALDLFKLARYIYNNYPLIGEITRKQSHSFVSLEKIGHTAISTDQLLGHIPEI
ncbi:MAG: serine hydrolase [Candidatus Pacebacteria bacterium]|nr:serine hydrolase [Candidatus Paceibacterota bacterium]